PAADIRLTISASRSGTCSAKSGDPNVVRTPVVSTRSLCATGSPCSSPGCSPRASASSAAAALASAWSNVLVTTALTTGSTSSIRLMCAATTSRADTSRPRIRPARSTALLSHRSVIEPPQSSVWLSLSQATLSRPSSQLMPGGELQLAQHRRYVALDRLRGDEQLSGDLLVGVAAGDQP